MELSPGAFASRIAASVGNTDKTAVNEGSGTGNILEAGISEFEVIIDISGELHINSIYIINNYVKKILMGNNNSSGQNIVFTTK